MTTQEDAVTSWALGSPDYTWVLAPQTEREGDAWGVFLEAMKFHMGAKGEK